MSLTRTLILTRTRTLTLTLTLILTPSPSPEQALLEQSKATLRATFSAIMRKRVFTLVFERSSELGWETVEKLHSARHNRGVVLCTGSTIKVCMPRIYTCPILF